MLIRMILAVTSLAGAAVWLLVSRGLGGGSSPAMKDASRQDDDRPARERFEVFDAEALSLARHRIGETEGPAASSGPTASANPALSDAAFTLEPR